MLRISKKADYAVFLLGAIARQGAYPGGSAGDAVVSAHEIARLAGLNKSVVANLLKEFARHGLLESVRGLKGGYRLARSPSDISLGEILEVVEGRFSLVDCIGEHPETGTGLLPLAKGSPSGSARPTGTPNRDLPTRDLPTRDHQCSLIAFCPSKNPMRVVHERISLLFHQIRLDELCSLGPAGSPGPVGSLGPVTAPAATNTHQGARSSLGSTR